jgi:hypothetical protein
MGKEFSKTYANLLSLAINGYIPEGKKRDNWKGLGSINIICAS